jgi:gas vesicle protein
MNNGKFFAGLALGALVGSALSCFAHSNRGRKLRRNIKICLPTRYKSYSGFTKSL